jgi:dodecin
MPFADRSPARQRPASDGQPLAFFRGSAEDGGRREHLSRSRRNTMSSVARVTTITVRSETSFEDAVAVGIARAAQTLRHVSGAWVKEQKVEANEGVITAWSVTLEVSFVLE